MSQNYDYNSTMLKQDKELIICFYVQYKLGNNI